MVHPVPSHGPDMKVSSQNIYVLLEAYFCFNLGRFARLDEVLRLIEELARSRGYSREGEPRRLLRIPEAPPRQALAMFRGEGNGLTIEQFRGLCANSFDVALLDPPYITPKQILVADCEKIMKASRTGRVCHLETPHTLYISATDAAKQKREGLQIFAGVGVKKRLSDYFGEKK